MPAQIAAILAHEMVHAAVRITAEHGKAFKRIAIGSGLFWPMRSTAPGDAFLATIRADLAGVGPIPHARLDTSGETARTKTLKWATSAKRLITFTTKRLSGISRLAA